MLTCYLAVRAQGVEMVEARVWPDRLAIEPGWEIHDGESGAARVVRGRLAARADVAYVDDWKSQVTLMRRQDVPEDQRPEADADVEAWPHVADDLASAAWVAVTGDMAARHAAEGGEVVTVGFHRGSGEGQLVHWRDGVSRALDVEWSDAMEAVEGTEEFADEEPEMSDVFDRLLRALTEGECSMRDVALACEHRTWVNALNRPSLGDWEAELMAVHDVAEEQRDDNEAIVQILDAAPEDAQTLELPEVGVAHRVRRPAFSWPIRSSSSVLQVPAELEWWVGDVAPVPGRGRNTGEGGASGLSDTSGRSVGVQHAPSTGAVLAVLAVVAMAVAAWMFGG